MDSLSRKMRTCTHAHIIHTSGSFSSSKADPCAQDSLFKVLIIKKIRYSCGKLYRSPRRKKNMPSLNNCPFFPMKYSLLKYSSILQKVRFNIFNLFNNKHGCILSLSRVISCSSYKKEWMARLGFDKKAEPQYLKLQILVRGTLLWHEPFYRFMPRYTRNNDNLISNLEFDNNKYCRHRD